jgi:hypothetical protein
MLLPRKAQAWFKSTNPTDDLYNIVLQGPSQLSLSDQDNERMAQAEKACSQGANVDYVDDGGVSLLHHAANFNDHGMVIFLLNKGADPTLRDQGGQQPWMFATGNSVLCTLLYRRSSNRSGITPQDKANYENLIKAIKEQEQPGNEPSGPGWQSKVAGWFK